jgi:hypothetical protein
LETAEGHAVELLQRTIEVSKEAQKLLAKIRVVLK